ncbi:MAG: hypothetical protein H6983_15480 [Ectothiorhodospiraceae bacterium]|nr:hypothetical protein [Ectothiorhodospiraceae bacterium]
MLRALLALVLVTRALVAPAQPAGEVIGVLTYHNHAPFITGDATGLTHELMARLRAAAPAGLELELRPTPRARLDVLLADWVQGRCASETARCDDRWVLVWVNPRWGFGDSAMTRFQWLPLMEDANVVVSRRSRRVEYAGPESLVGLRLGAIRGHRYVGVDPLVEAGRIERLDGERERSNLLMLLQGRIDVTVLPLSSVRHYLEHDPVMASRGADIFVAERHHQDYVRYLMAPPSRDDLRAMAARALAAEVDPPRASR